MSQSRAACLSFQDLILTLHHYWGEQGCVILQPYDMEMGAGTFHPATVLARAWARAVARRLCPAVPPPDRRPLWRKSQPAGRLLPISGGAEAEPGRPPGALSRQPRGDRDRPAQARHPLRRGRLGKPDAGRLGPGLGSVVRRDGSDPVHLFPAGRRVRMQAGDGRADLRARAAGDVHPGRRQCLRPQVQRRRASPTATCSSRTSARCRPIISRSPTPSALFDLFRKAAAECQNCLDAKLPIPAYEQAIKASHIFNTLQARGVISVAERQAYIGRVRDLAKAACAAWLECSGEAA